MLWRYRVLVSLVCVIIVFTIEFAGPPIPQAKAAYTVANSARFNATNSDYLNRTFSAASSQNVYTFSAWVKRGTLGTTENLFGVSANYSFGFTSTDQLAATIAGVAQASTTALYRDPTAWMHVMYVQNQNAMTLYVNGGSVATGSSTNAQFNTAAAHQLGAANTTNYFDGYMADVYFVDGQALTPSSFGASDGNGYWRPVAYTGTYGTNGFHIAFGTANTLGTDSSSNANTWTVNGLTASDQMLDTPTDSFATGNPIAPGGGTYSNANLANTGAATSTIFMSAGKWYWEVTATTSSVVAGVISATGVPNTTSITASTRAGFFFDAGAGTLNVTTDGNTYSSVATGLTDGQFAYSAGGGNSINYGALAGFTGTTTVYLTSGTSWIVPQDFNSSNNTIEVIGGGCGGARKATVTAQFGGGGGGGSGNNNNTAGGTTGGDGGLYGGGGGAEGRPSSTFGGAGGAGAQGIVVIKYAPAVGNTYVAYLFKGISGFSNFGTYFGNGNASGPFVYTGFHPRHILIKRTDTTGDWSILDTARDTYNPGLATSTANTALADGSNTNVDYLVNGFKLRSAQAAYNASGGQYIYMSFADTPFKYSAFTALSSVISSAFSFLMGMELLNY